MDFFGGIVSLARLLALPAAENRNQSLFPVHQ